MLYEGLVTTVEAALNNTHNGEGDAILLAGRDMDSPERFRLATGTVTAYTRRAPGKTKGNEDSAAVIPLDDHRTVLAVADGLGGQPEGASASRIALQALTEALIDVEDSPEVLQHAILKGIEEGNRRVLTLGSGAGTTLTVAALIGNSMRHYHIGDSTLLLTGQRGKVKHQTVAQSPVGIALAMGVLSEQEAMFHPQRHLVSNVVGTSQLQVAVSLPVKIARRDRLLLATDGLMDNFFERDIVDAIRTGDDLEAATELVASCHERMSHPLAGIPSKPDDLTFLIYRRS
jgi:serine/threonine protein phosphatase PrpC